MRIKWVKTTDQLPPIGKGVLVTNGVDVTAAELFDVLGECLHWCPHGITGYDTEFLFDDRLITHWAPLPDPPKEGKKWRVQIDYPGPLNVTLDKKIKKAMESIGAKWYAQGMNLETNVRDLAFELKNPPWGDTPVEALLKGDAK